MVFDPSFKKMKSAVISRTFMKVKKLNQYKPFRSGILSSCSFGFQFSFRVIIWFQNNIRFTSDFLSLLAKNRFLGSAQRKLSSPFTTSQRVLNILEDYETRKTTKQGTGKCWLFFACCADAAGESRKEVQFIYLYFIRPGFHHAIRIIETIEIIGIRGP